MVHGQSEGWIPSLGASGQGRAARQREVCGSPRRGAAESEMPGQRGLFQPLAWPYVEGLRLDEALHPLTILAVGLYGETLPNPEWRADPVGRAVEIRVQGHQVNRADHAYRSAAANNLERHGAERVRLLCQRQSPRSTTPRAGARRLSGASGRGGFFGSDRRPTLMFQWLRRRGSSHLYAGMDLRRYF